MSEQRRLSVRLYKSTRNPGNFLPYDFFYSDGMLGTDIKEGCEAANLGELLRDAVAEFGVLKGQGSP